MEPSAENDWRMLDRVIPGGDVSISIGKRVEETKSERVASRYFEDLKVGERFSSEAYEVPGKAIIEFAEKFDPQMFHLNPKSAERSIFKGLVASGWHTAAMYASFREDARSGGGRTWPWGGRTALAECRSPGRYPARGNGNSGGAPLAIEAETRCHSASKHHQQ